MNKPAKEHLFIRLLKSNFILWLIRQWLLIKAIDQAEPGETLAAIKTQLSINKGLRQAKKLQEKRAKKMAAYLKTLHVNEPKTKPNRATP